MLFSIIISFSLLTISNCIDSLELSSTTYPFQIGTIDSNTIVIFTTQKTALYNVNTNTITYINETLAINNYLNFAIGATFENIQYIFSGSDLVSISGNTVVKSNPSPNLASSSTFCFPYKDYNNITQGFFRLQGFTLSLYKFDSMSSSSDSFPLSGSVYGLGAIYSISNNQVYEIIHIGLNLYSVIFDITDNSISYSRHYLQSYGPFINRYTTEYESIMTNSTTFVICGIRYDYCSSCSTQYYYYIKCALVNYGVNYADVKSSADICSHRLVPSYFKVAILSEIDKRLIALFEKNSNIYFYTFNYDLSSIRSYENIVGISYARFTVINSTNIYFAFYSSLVNGHQGFLFSYPECTSNEKTIIYHNHTRIRDLLKERVNLLVMH